MVFFLIHSSSDPNVGSSASTDRKPEQLTCLKVALGEGMGDRPGTSEGALRGGQEEAADVRVGMVSAGNGPVLAVEQGGRWYRWTPPKEAPAGSSWSAVDVLATGGHVEPDGMLHPARLLPPILPPRNLICLGKNYRAHAEEFAAYASEPEIVPEAPIVFTKPAAALCGARDVVTVERQVTTALDYEAELGVVIGAGGERIEAEDAERHVAGYTIINDITARDLQRRHGQWFLGKSLYGATPAGPVIVSTEEFTDLAARSIRCWVNDDLRQEAKLGEMIFGVAETIAEISRIFPLEPGDLIAMGTPSGVGVGSNPPRYLQDGDRVVCEIEDIGRLDNTIHFV
jgi:2-keto-4-pentenoate hydratase/2-oxohepta-3-ene-1,7-dioic acid hydratase in catechol pathway